MSERSNEGEAGFFAYHCDNEIHVKDPDEVTETQQGRVWEAFTECPDCGQFVRTCSDDTADSLPVEEGTGDGGEEVIP